MQAGDQLEAMTWIINHLFTAVVNSERTLETSVINFFPGVSDPRESSSILD